APLSSPKTISVGGVSWRKRLSWDRDRMRSGPDCVWAHVQLKRDRSFPIRVRPNMPKAVLYRVVLCFALALYLLHPVRTLAWGYQGHEVVGSVADRLLSNNAKNQVRAILNGPAAPDDPNAPVKLAPKRELKLQQAGPWADCVKSVVRHDDGKFHY